MHPSVLIVDDEEPIGALCSDILQLHGYKTCVLSNPLDCLENLRHNTYDIMLVDLRMPGLNGFQVMDMARKIQPQIAVVMMTGVGTLETAVDALRSGADGLTLKPFTSQELVENLHYALDIRVRKIDAQRLQAIRPIFDVTEQLFSKTDFVHLETFLVRASHNLIPSCAVGFFDFSMIVKNHDRTEKQPNTDVAEEHLNFHQEFNNIKSNNFEGVTLTDPEINPQALLLAARTAVDKDLVNNTASVEAFNFDLTKEAPNLKDLGIGSVLGAAISISQDNFIFDSVDSSFVFNGSPNIPENEFGTRNHQNRMIIMLRKAGDENFQQVEKEIFLILCRQGKAAIENANLHAALQNTIQRLENSECSLRETIERLETSQRALIQAEKLATAGRLTASIAHEINNPLQAVQNCLHLASRDELSTDSKQEYLNLAGEELTRLMKTVQQMLGFYRPGQLDRKPININQVLNNVLSLTKTQLKQQQIQLVLNLASDIPDVYIVADQIQQVFLNLILNACQAMENHSHDGKIAQLTISTSYQTLTKPSCGPKGNNRVKEVCIVFVDTGPGIPPENINHIFEPFYSTKSNGSGLGLAISYGIISAHGGDIEVSSSPEGACFRVILYVDECPENS